MAQDPKHAGPTPPQPEQRQEPPGRTAEMTPKPDHGEESYRGSGKLEGRAAVITGGDSGIGRAVAIAFARKGAERAGQPKELAPTFVLLASEDGSYMTGAVVPVTGGQPMLWVRGLVRPAAVGPTCSRCAANVV